MESATAQTLQDVENLVLRLYQPGVPPQQLVDIQRQLHTLQLSEHGWDIANSLLGSADPTARFFGALTYNIKLNSAHSPLSEADKNALERSIIRWTITNIANRDTKTITKLCTTLALFYIRNSDRLATSIGKFVFAVLEGDGVALDPTPSILSIDKGLLSSGIEPYTYRTILNYITALAEEAAKTVSTSTPEQYARLKDQYSKAIQDIIYLTYFALTEYRRADDDSTTYSSVCDGAVASLAPTTYFYLNHGVRHEETLQQLKACLTAGLNWCTTSLSEPAIEQLEEILATSSRILDNAQYRTVLDLINSDWGKQNLAELKDGSATGEDNKYIALLLAFGDVQLQELLEAATSSACDATSQEFFEIMQELLACDGYPELEDQVIPRTLEFWNTFVEFVEDGISDGTASAWLAFATNHVVRMAQQIRVKVCLPSWTEWETLSADERGSLRDFRTDVKDLLQSAYRIVGPPLVEFLVRKALEAVAKSDWHDAESSLFCLVACEATSLDKNDPIFIALFDSNLFSLVLNDDDPSQITRRTAIDLLGQSTRVFKRNTAYLSPALNFLFPSLQHPKSSDQASRSIYALCSVCRKELVSELAVFLAQYEAFIALPNVSEFAIERISGAIGVLLQALPSLSQTIDGVQRLLTYVSSGLASAQELLTEGRNEEGCVVAAKSMRCLSSIAKSLQAPTDDELIDIDAENEIFASVDAETKQKLDNLQSQIFGILSKAIEILGDDGEIIDDVCNVFKAGFTEVQHSAFHFAPHIVVQFFSITNIGTPRIESVLGMGCAFLRSLKAGDDSVESSVAQLAQHLANLAQQLGDARADAEVAQSIIEMLTRFMPNHLHNLLQLQPISQVETLFGLTIGAIEVPEPLPKRSALKFWNEFLDVTSVSSAATTGAARDQVIVHYGPAFAQAIVRQIAGRASRVDLEFFVNPLRRLLKSSSQAKAWLEAALLSEVPNDKATEIDKRRLLGQLATAGTQRQLKQLITDFWSHCQGMSSGYAPMKAIEV